MGKGDHGHCLEIGSDSLAQSCSQKGIHLHTPKTQPWNLRMWAVTWTFVPLLLPSWPNQSHKGKRLKTFPMWADTPQACSWDVAEFAIHLQTGELIIYLEACTHAIKISNSPCTVRSLPRDLGMPGGTHVLPSVAEGDTKAQKCPSLLCCWRQDLCLPHLPGPGEHVLGESWQPHSGTVMEKHPEIPRRRTADEHSSGNPTWLHYTWFYHPVQLQHKHSSAGTRAGASNSSSRATARSQGRRWIITTVITTQTPSLGDINQLVNRSSGSGSSYPAWHDRLIEQDIKNPNCRTRHSSMIWMCSAGTVKYKFTQSAVTLLKQLLIRERSHQSFERKRTFLRSFHTDICSLSLSLLYVALHWWSTCALSHATAALSALGSWIWASKDEMAKWESTCGQQSWLKREIPGVSAGSFPWMFLPTLLSHEEH